MKSDLFTALRKYSINSKNDPIENFITEAFSWILKNNFDLVKYFIEEIFYNSEEKVVLEKESFSCETQVNFNGFYPDMLISTKDNKFIFEHKVWSELHENQIENYKKFAEENYKNFKIILITANEAQHLSKSTDKNLCWDKVYLTIKKWLSENEKIENKVIIESFLNLLKEEGLGPASPINISSVRYYNISKGLEKSIKEFLKIIENKHEKRLRELLTEDSWIECSYGRYGFRIFKDWNPGLFIGFLLNEKDHNVPPIAGKESPDFSIIVDINNKFHNKYFNMEEYKEFKSDIKNIIKNTHYNWDLYDIEENGKNQNKWHPLHIRVPMIEIFKDTIKIEEQIDSFFKYSEDMIKKIISLESLKNLKKELI